MSKKSSKKPEIVYIAGLNLSGLWSKKPLKAKWEPSLKSWYVVDSGSWHTGNCYAQKLGLDKPISGGIIRFASTSKSEVQTWIDGVLAAFSFLNDWTWILREE